MQAAAVVPVGFSFSQGCTALSITGGEGDGERYPPQGSCRVVQALSSRIAMATASTGAAEMVRKPSARPAAWKSLAHAKPGTEGACSGACQDGKGDLSLVLGGGRWISSQRGLGGTLHLGVVVVVGTWKGHGWSQG